MNVDHIRLVECNIVTVFRELRFTQVLAELARRLLPEHPSPLITEIPGQMLAVVYPDRRIECRFANRRVHVSDKRGVTPGEHPFGLVALNAIEAACSSSGGRESIVAYGYNYVVQLTEKNATHYLSGRFFREAGNISQTFEGELRAIGFNAVLEVPRVRRVVNLGVGPVQNTTDQIQVSGNYHYEGQSPPSIPADIDGQAAQQYEEFVKALQRL